MSPFANCWNASRTALMDLSGGWDDGLCDLFGVPAGPGLVGFLRREWSEPQPGSAPSCGVSPSRDDARSSPILLGGFLHGFAGMFLFVVALVILFSFDRLLGRVIGEEIAIDVVAHVAIEDLRDERPPSRV